MIAQLITLLLSASSALELPRRPLLLGPAAATAASKVNANELPSPLVRILTNPSFVDSRDYRYVTTPSGLRIVVAGDPDARDATLALTVGAGQLREPFEGLSHLTEHLTMAASNLEQKAADYDGVANAYTAFDRTVYVANCAPRYIGALLRSVSSAVSPTAAEKFDASTTRREARRVDAEAQVTPSGAALDLELLRDRSVGPLSKFGPGTRYTLLPTKFDKDGNGADRAASFARKLFRERYGLRDATLAVVAPVDADRLASAVVNAFPQPPARSFPVPQPYTTDPLPDQGAPDLVVSKQQPGRSDVVTLHWSIPYDRVGGFAAYKARRPDVVAAHALAHGGPGGLASRLKRAGVALQPRPGAPAVYAKASPVVGDADTGFALFEIRVPLARADGWRDAVAAILAACAALASSAPSAIQSVARDCAALADRNCRDAPRPPTAVELAENMRSERDPRALAAAGRRFRAPPRDVAVSTLALAALLTPQRCRATAFLQRPESQLIQLDAATLSRRIPYARVDLEDALWQRPAKKWWRPPQPCVYCDLLRRGTTKAESPGQVESVPRPRGARGPAREGRADGPARAGLYLPCWRVSSGNAFMRASARLWQLLVADAVAEPLFGASLAGCKYALGFYKDSGVSDESVPPAGVRVALAAPAPELLPRLAADYASKVNALADPTRSSSAGRFARAKQLALRERNLDEPTRRALAAAAAADARREAQRLFASAARAAPKHAESLVTGLDETASRRLVSNLFEALPELDKAELPSLEVPDGRRPAGPLTARAAWDHPVAQDACLASGVPAMAGVCGRG